MALAKYLRDSWKNVSPEVYRTRMIDWRRSETIVRVDQPLRLDRARALGYKAKEGVFIVRIRLVRGGHKRMRPRKGRRSARMTPRKVVSMNYREIAEQRVARKYTNCEVINSYLIGKDGLHAFYEVILVDRAAPTIKNDKQLSYVTNPANKARALRGLTSAGHKARGLRNSTVKAPKVRPSLRANRRRGN